MTMKQKSDTKTTEMAGLGVDPWPTATFANPARVERADAAVPPVGWHRLGDLARGIIGLEALHLLAEHPARNRPADVAWLAHRLRERLRESPAVLADLESPEAPPAHALLTAVVGKLQKRAELLADVRVRAEELGRAIETLERVPR